MLSGCDWTVKLWWFERCSICVICRILFALKLEIDYTISKHDMKTNPHWISECNGLTSHNVMMMLILESHSIVTVISSNSSLCTSVTMTSCHHILYHHVTKSWSQHLWHWISLCSCAGVKNQLTHDTSLYPASSHYCMLWLAQSQFSVWIWSSWLKKHHPK